MKSLLLLVAILFPVLANAADNVATFGNQNSSNVYRVVADTDGVVTFASDTGIKYPYEHYTSANTNNTLTAAESGKVITDTGAASGPTATGSCSKHILPTAAPGLVFTFTAGSKCSMTVDTADTNDTILYSISGTGLDAGDSIKSTGQAGDSVTVFSTLANKWSIIQMKGSWTDNGTN